MPVPKASGLFLIMPSTDDPPKANPQAEPAPDKPTINPNPINASTFPILPLLYNVPFEIRLESTNKIVKSLLA
jgi:hypothetical protein